MPLKTLIVDDEPIARKVLREELELIADVKVIGEAADGARGAWRRSAPRSPTWCCSIFRCRPWAAWRWFAG